MLRMRLIRTELIVKVPPLSSISFSSLLLRIVSILFQPPLLLSDTLPAVAQALDAMTNPLDKMKGEIYASQIYLIVFTSLCIWDWLLLLPLEYLYIHRATWSPLKVFYLLK